MAPVSPYQWDFVTPGLPDAAFEAAPGFSPTPMELRVMLLAHLRPRPDSVVWDVGGGTGALALEIARLLPGGRVQALERDPEAVELLQRNRARFGITNLEVFEGQAPGDLAPGGRLVISTSSLEGLVDATDHLGQLEARDLQVVQATVHRMQRRGDQTRLAAAEPLFVIAAERHP